MGLAADRRRFNMACGGCRGGGNRHGAKKGGADLRKFAYLNPQQLEYLKRLDEEEAKKAEEDKEGKK